jgi:hypothetical protein
VRPPDALRRLAVSTARWAPGLALATLLAGCQTFSDAQPGQGRNVVIAGHPYDQIWEAALKVARQHFVIHEEAKTEGIIFGERGGTAGGWVAIYLTGAGANAYRVEVVRKGKYVGQLTWTDWEKRVLAEVQAALGMPAAR